MTDDPLDHPQEMEPIKLPTREEHRRIIRRLWMGCIGAACAIFVVTGGVVLGLFMEGKDSKRIVEITTAIFQVLVLSYGMGFFVPAFLTSLMKMSLGVEMSREGLSVGKQTAELLRGFAKDIKPIIHDLKEIVGPARELVDDLKGQKTGSIVAFVEKLSKDGTVERLAKSLEEIGSKIHDALERVEKKKVDDMIDRI